LPWAPTQRVRLHRPMPTTTMRVSYDLPHFEVNVNVKVNGTPVASKWSRTFFGQTSFKAALFAPAVPEIQKAFEGLKDGLVGYSQLCRSGKARMRKRTISELLQAIDCTTRNRQAVPCRKFQSPRNRAVFRAKTSRFEAKSPKESQKTWDSGHF